ncbi:MAG TPA: hypothetical protein VH482_21575 [Thermomicrobiales bacterium]
MLVLAACVSGDAADQEQMETREATRGAVLGEIQATDFAARFRQPPGTPKPTATTAPGLDTLVLASSVNSDGSPLQQISSVSGFGASTVYACARISNARSGQKVIAVWSTIDGTEVARSEQKLDAGGFERWVALPWQMNGSPLGGTYAVTIYVDKVDPAHELNSLVFRVG